MLEEYLYSEGETLQKARDVASASIKWGYVVLDEEVLAARQTQNINMISNTIEDAYVRAVQNIPEGASI